MRIFEFGAFLMGLSAVFGYLNLRLPHTISLVVIALMPRVAANIVAPPRCIIAPSMA
jgi:hypothetical protein